MKGKLWREGSEGTGSEGTGDWKVEEMSMKGWIELTGGRMREEKETGSKDIRKLGN